MNKMLHTCEIACTTFLSHIPSQIDYPNNRHNQFMGKESSCGKMEGTFSSIGLMDFKYVLHILFSASFMQILEHN